MISLKTHSTHKKHMYNENRASGRKQTAPLDVDYPPLVVRLPGVIARWLIWVRVCFAVSLRLPLIWRNKNRLSQVWDKTLEHCGVCLQALWRQV